MDVCIVVCAKRKKRGGGRTPKHEDLADVADELGLSMTETTPSTGSQEAFLLGEVKVDGPGRLIIQGEAESAIRVAHEIARRCGPMVVIEADKHVIDASHSVEDVRAVLGPNYRLRDSATPREIEVVELKDRRATFLAPAASRISKSFVLSAIVSAPRNARMHRRLISMSDIWRNSTDPRVAESMFEGWSPIFIESIDIEPDEGRVTFVVSDAALLAHLEVGTTWESEATDFGLLERGDRASDDLIVRMGCRGGRLRNIIADTLEGLGASVRQERLRVVHEPKRIPRFTAERDGEWMALEFFPLGGPHPDFDEAYVGGSSAEFVLTLLVELGEKLDYEVGISSIYVHEGVELTSSMRKKDRATAFALFGRLV